MTRRTNHPHLFHYRGHENREAELHLGGRDLSIELTRREFDGMQRQA